MKDKIKFYSDVQRYEIINLNDGETYGTLSNHDLIIDEYGNLKYLTLSDMKSGGLFFKNSKNNIHAPWESIRKIGSKTIIIDIDDMENGGEIDPYIY